MKYIRTKDGRIAEVKENMVVKVCDDATRLVYKEKPYICVLNGDDDIIYQADTIDELCDVLIFYKKVYQMFHKKALDDLKEIIRSEKRWWEDEDDCERTLQSNKKHCYGAIWIELPNGASRLEPVAKMNEEGELKLL